MELNSHYIDLKELFKEHNQKLCVTPQLIRNVLEELKMDEEEEITITGTYGDWGWFFNYVLSQVMEGESKSEE